MKMLDDGFEDKVKDLRKLKHKTLADKGILKIRSKKRKAAHSQNSLVRNIRKSISWFSDAVTSCQASDYGMNMNEWWKRWKVRIGFVTVWKVWVALVDTFVEVNNVVLVEVSLKKAWVTSNPNPK